MIPENIVCYGSSDPWPDLIPLRAGPLSLSYSEGSLRRICYGQDEIVNRIYVAVRDPNWETLPGRLTEQRRQVRQDSFFIEFQSEHRQDDINFLWQGSLMGTPEGSVTFTMEGEAKSDFHSNRIGLCVLHPMSLAGRSCQIEHADGSISSSFFPDLIAPREPFLGFHTLTYEIAPGIRAQVRLEGDIFNTEDQRNWGDASYKTYSTSLAPFPAFVPRGTRLRHSVTVRLLDSAPLLPTSISDQYTVRLTGKSRRMPPLGLCLSSRQTMLSTREARRLKALNLSHLRADLDSQSQRSLQEQLQLAMDSSLTVGAPLELAIHLSSSPSKELEAICQAVNELGPRLARWLVFQHDRLVTGREVFSLAKEKLSRYGAPIGAGTNAYFAQVNAVHPPNEADLLVYSLSPLVHSIDSWTLIENAAAFAETIRSARNFWNKPILIGPVTLRKRWNPDATGPERKTEPDELPYQVDARQMSLLGAGWTVASLRALIQGGADLLTYYETIGWRGVMESESGSPLPSRFPSSPGSVFPIYHLLADLAEMADGVVEYCQPSDASVIEALTLRKGTVYRTLAVNLTPHLHQVTFPDIVGRAHLRLLDAGNAELAMTSPEDFRAISTQQLTAGTDGLTLEIPPFGLARLDWS